MEWDGWNGIDEMADWIDGIGWEFILCCNYSMEYSVLYEVVTYCM